MCYVVTYFSIFNKIRLLGYVWHIFPCLCSKQKISNESFKLSTSFKVWHIFLNTNLIMKVCIGLWNGSIYFIDILNI